MSENTANEEMIERMKANGEEWVFKVPCRSDTYVNSASGNVEVFCGIIGILDHALDSHRWVKVRTRPEVIEAEIEMVPYANLLKQVEQDLKNALETLERIRKGAE